MWQSNLVEMKHCGGDFPPVSDGMGILFKIGQNGFQYSTLIVSIHLQIVAKPEANRIEYDIPTCCYLVHRRVCVVYI